MKKCCIAKVITKIKECLQLKRKKLLKNYPIIEYTTTGLDNTLPNKYVSNCEYIISEIINPVKERYPKSLITSWYRSPEVNKAVGGAARSSHLTAEGIDITALPAVPIITLFKWVRKNLKVDYIKMYPTHIHITKRKKL